MPRAQQRTDRQRTKPVGITNLQPLPQRKCQVNRRIVPVNLGSVTVKPCRVVSSRGHVTELQKLSVIDRRLLVKATFVLT